MEFRIFSFFFVGLLTLGIPTVSYASDDDDEETEEYYTDEDTDEGFETSNFYSLESTKGQIVKLKQGLDKLNQAAIENPDHFKTLCRELLKKLHKMGKKLDNHDNNGDYGKINKKDKSRIFDIINTLIKQLEALKDVENIKLEINFKDYSKEYTLHNKALFSYVKFIQSPGYGNPLDELIRLIICVQYNEQQYGY